MIPLARKYLCDSSTSASGEGNVLLSRSSTGEVVGPIQFYGRFTHHMRCVSPGLKHLTHLSLQGCDYITASGMRCFGGLSSLEALDLEMCSRLHGGFRYLAGKGLFLGSVQSGHTCARKAGCWMTM
jgi:hypothetical protein